MKTSKKTKQSPRKAKQTLAVSPEFIPMMNRIKEVLSERFVLPLTLRQATEIVIRLAHAKYCGKARK